MRGLPTYMYLSKKEQQLETVAHAYLGGKYPAGIKSQHRAIATVGVDEEDTKTLQDLKFKIARVLAARGYDERNDIDKVLDIIAEMQDIQIELKRIDNVLAALEQYKPDFAKLLKYKYIDGYSSTTAAVALNITERTFVRWHKRAIAEYLELAANCL
ncbi:hypothetical protein J40TS1_34230 [Paenibacillus montaniterrae]|uniref:RNA polymerase sigma-70 ECF-like HTH domain-containing protein n=1 Tax=Paenibacillus montaniterrae TaxID=429341 RepID=A0A920CYC8_9BACL|nr:hypothetical protein J40TS1_34230 [Paenibacillus montaniterrae]